MVSGLKIIVLSLFWVYLAEEKFIKIPFVKISMAEEVSEISSLLGDFNTKIKDIEERHDMLKERLLLLSQSFLKNEERMGKEFAILREEFSEMRMDLDRLKENVQSLIRDSSDFVRRDELKVLERYMKMWEPLKFMKEDEVKKMINDKMKK